MTSPTPAEIAAGLSEAQREALLSDSLAERPEVFDLARMGLVWKLADHFNLVTGAVVKGGWRLRPKGLAVRAQLRGEQ